MPAISEVPAGPMTPACWPRPIVISGATGELKTRILPSASTTAVLLPCGVIIAHPGRARSRAGPSLLMIGGGGAVDCAATLVGQTSATPSLIWCQVSLVVGLNAMAVVVPRIPRVLV